MQSEDSTRSFNVTQWTFIYIAVIFFSTMDTYSRESCSFIILKFNLHLKNIFCGSSILNQGQIIAPFFMFSPISDLPNLIPPPVHYLTFLTCALLLHSLV